MACYRQYTGVLKIDTEIVEYHATMESCSDKFHVEIPNVV
jgi:hypothetical protein